MVLGLGLYLEPFYELSVHEIPPTQEFDIRELFDAILYRASIATIKKTKV